MRIATVSILLLLCVAAASAVLGAAGSAVLPGWSGDYGSQGPHRAQLAQAAGQGATYADVSPIFEKHCLMCHSGAKPPNGLRLDSYANVMAGAKGGKVVTLGQPDKSELVKRIKGISKPRMPRNGPPWLSDNEIGLIERWIAAGAPEGGKS